MTIFCTHKWSWPRKREKKSEHYQYCVVCGKERTYDWEKMRAA